jgi:hypothetical protein
VRERERGGREGGREGVSERERESRVVRLSLSLNTTPLSLSRTPALFL